jgi:hypothetical protein
MSWLSPISSEPVVAIHAALLPANGDGEILLFGGDDHDRAANIAGQWIIADALIAVILYRRLSM